MSKTILLRLPNWLGDAVMCSSAFEKLKLSYKDAKFIIVGSQVVEIFASDSRVERVIIDESKKAKCRIYATYHLAKLAGSADISFCFTNGFFGALFLFFTRSKVRVGYATNFRSFLLTNAVKMPTIKPFHQVQKYEYLLKDFVSEKIFSSFIPLKLPIHNRSDIVKNCKKAIGINPGAAYGSAKCWEREYFLEIIKVFLEQGHIIYLFGSGVGLQIDSKDLQQYAFLQSKNFIDITNKTTLSELVEAINKLELFITNDSGPMHIAAALNVKTLSIFGSTDTADTCPWNVAIAQEFFYPNAQILKQCASVDSKESMSDFMPKDITGLNLVQAKNLHIISKHIECSPCKKRICPLKHHKCMKDITPSEVLAIANSALQHYKDK